MSNAWKDYSIASDLLEIYAREREEVREYVSSLCTRGYTVILFGSRARGDHKIYSDWDLLVVGKDRPTTPPGQIDLHFVDAESVEREIQEFNTVVIDAFYEGVVQCDNLSIFTRYREMVLRRINGLRKTRDGWIRTSTQ
ncbi:MULTISPECIES: nucleotidyltransferase domain-containing protein [Metallosphaera]|uniref:DNA polymerase n=2 Tax=Metallosphaera TaxID=41980 RepID=A0A0K1SHV8_9CREN|nr:MULTISPECIES: nucleotidyltransferase domain-containing protein [Metallosphaera]AKV74359.1 DNA polymerase [Metallosphaera sedula]AKV76598.1 DNA polymerase [Metallosphaera sedula]AKV78850.1 DNA polymerase [Metallosphaera sedula]AKV81095.1 DNA polymerase [Metallosphaera sedula]AKV83333.1 DNA polymerase [Metallosphaera sedula]